MTRWTLVLAGLLLAPATALAHDPDTMRAHHEEMERRMAEMEKKLDDLLAKAHAASREDKAEAMLAVVDQLVAEHREMRRMGREMMQRMHAGGPGPGMMHRHGMMHGGPPTTPPPPQPTNQPG
jgi:hypothetical protein